MMGFAKFDFYWNLHCGSYYNSAQAHICAGQARASPADYKGRRLPCWVRGVVPQLFFKASNKVRKIILIIIKWDIFFLLLIKNKISFHAIYFVSNSWKGIIYISSRNRCYVWWVHYVCNRNNLPFLPCPSMSPKWFWTVQIILVECQLFWLAPICFGQVQIILDRFKL